MNQICYFLFTLVVILFNLSVESRRLNKSKFFFSFEEEQNEPNVEDEYIQKIKNETIETKARNPTNLGDLSMVLISRIQLI